MRFVGRSADLGELVRAWNEARAGTPRLVVVRGAPGIGKTTLLNQFLSTVDDATVLHGAAQENSSIPYLSVGAALRPLWDGEASPFDRYVRGHQTAATPLTPSELRLDLILEIAGTVIERAAHGPVLLAIDDAHWADSATVELLGHLLQSVSAERHPLSLLVLLAMRPVGGDVHAVRLVERARRESWTQVRDVGGLDLVEVDELVREVAGHRPSRPLLRALHAASGGNPLLVRSLLDRLNAFGGVVLRGDVLVQTSSAELLASPHDLDQLLRDRLANVSAGCRRVLVVAAFLGDDTSLSTLEALAGADQDRFDAAIDEAQQAGLIDADQERYRFDHPQLRQVLYQSLRGRRRADLHVRIADHLEASTGTDDLMVSIAIAHHLRHARKSVDPQRLERWASAAARAATELGAWGEAADLYEVALDMIDLTAPEATASRALVASRAAFAHWYNHDNAKARAHAESATQLAKRVGDFDLWASALDVIARSIWAGSQVEEDISENLWRFDEFIEASEGVHTPAVAKAHWLAGTLRIGSDLRTAGELLATARALSEELEDDGFASDLALSEGGAALSAADFAGAIAGFTRSEERAVRAGDPLRHAAALSRRAMTHRMRAELDDAEADASIAAAETRSGGLWAEHGLAESLLCGIAAARGDAGDAIEHGLAGQRFTEWSGFGQAATQLYPALAWAYAAHGLTDQSRAALDSLARFESRMERMFRPLLHAIEGDREGALVSLRSARRVAASSPLLAAYLHSVEVEVVDLLDVDRDLRDATALLTAMAETGLCFLPGWPLFVPRIAAVAAARSGDVATADRWISHAIDIAKRAGADRELERLDIRVDPAKGVRR